jgi:hypothetical protein
MNFPIVQSLTKFTEGLGISPVTVWKYRRDGILTTHNLHGKQFVTAADAERFVQRLTSGEFARKKVVPKPPRARRKAQED